MNPCTHPDFAAFVDVARIFPPGPAGEPDETKPAEGFTAEIRVHCAVCDEPMVFHGQGLAVGMMPGRPCISPDGLELRAPLRPRSSDPHTGLGLAGFTARIAEGMPGANN